MSLRYNKRHLFDMLKRDSLSRDDKQAIRFALWAISVQQGGDTPEPVFPFWRYVRYTDDGCALYQCLNCKSQWESRTQPGWLDHHDKFDGLDESGGGIKDRDGNVYHYKLKDEAVYKPVMIYCPFCGIEWEGPIRRDYDNEYMRGEKRLARDKAIEVARPTAPTVAWWWVMQTREIWPDRDGPGNWRDEGRYNPDRYGSVRIAKELRDRRERCKQEDAHSAELFGVKHEARIIKMSGEELKQKYPQNWCPLREVY